MIVIHWCLQMLRGACVTACSLHPAFRVCVPPVSQGGGRVDAVHPRLLHGRGGAAPAQPGKSVRWCAVLWLMPVSPACLCIVVSEEHKQNLGVCCCRRRAQYLQLPAVWLSVPSSGRWCVLEGVEWNRWPSKIQARSNPKPQNAPNRIMGPARTCVDIHIFHVC